MQNSDFDLIIVGGGSAGCVLASRLSEDSFRKVLLIEAGKSYPPGEEPQTIKDTGFRTAFNLAFYFKGLLNRPKKNSDGKGDATIQPRVLGGGSSVNAMHAQRGLPRDYDGWASLGIERWCWDDVLPYFRKLETDLDFSGLDHGQDGPIKIGRVPESKWSPLSKAFRDYCVANGDDIFEDIMTTPGDGVGPIALTKDGDKRSSALEYLDANVRARGNLTILSDTTVRRLLLDGNRIVGVEIDGGKGKPGEVIKALETIVCCGTVHSPTLLMRSGIGPANQLKAAGIDVLIDRAGVGRNLDSHPILSVTAHLKPEGRAENTLEPPCNIVQRYSSGVEGCPPTDMVINLWERITSSHVRDPLGQQMADFMFILHKAYSKGGVALDPASPFAAPVVHFNTLDDPRDYRRMEDACRRALEISRAPGIAEKLTTAMFVKMSMLHVIYLSDSGLGRVLAAIGAIVMNSSARLARWIMSWTGTPLDSPNLDKVLRNNVLAGGHSVGTCRLGTESDDLAVVDNKCRVIGATGLRVVDASIFPNMMTAGTNLPVIMAAEKCAAEIRGAVA